MARFCVLHVLDIVRWGKARVVFAVSEGMKMESLIFMFMDRLSQVMLTQLKKKPVIHYNPGSKIFSIATTGCNWLCKYCQNSDISQRRKVEGVDMTPEQEANTAV